MSNMPESIWADRSNDGLPQYKDTPFGIWWHDARDGYTQYIRADAALSALDGGEVAAMKERKMDNRIQHDDEGEIDEIVADGGAHLERMDRRRWFLECHRADGSSVAVWIEGRVTMTEERPA